VHAIDPSEKMLEQARRKQHPRVQYERSSGEQLPLSDESVDLVFMSMVFHHFDNPVKVAHECHRVLRPGGSVCLRAGSREQIFTYPQVRFFGRSASILDGLMQSSDFIADTFLKAGLRCVHHELVESEVAVNWKEYAEKISYRADSVLSQLTDEEFRAGLNELRRFAQGQPDEKPVLEIIDLFVFRRYE
jgi:ubiquinone/menaquinone biosynthesis C-methylase UbiE